MLSICKNTAVVVQLLSQIWLCDPMDYSTPGFPILHYFPEFAQSHVHWVSDAIQPSHSFLPPFPPSLSLSQHRGLFQWSWLFASGGQSMGASTSASVLPLNIQGWFPLGLTGLISLLSKGLSRVYSSTTVWKHQLFGIQPRKSKGEGKQLCIQGKGRKRDVYFSYKGYARNKECIFVKEKRVVISKVKWLIVLE